MTPNPSPFRKKFEAVFINFFLSIYGICLMIAWLGTRALEIISKARDFGFTGIGVNQKGNARFIHLDISKDSQGRPRPHIWSY